jgi:hypothetical protein
LPKGINDVPRIGGVERVHRGDGCGELSHDFPFSLKISGIQTCLE